MPAGMPAARSFGHALRIGSVLILNGSTPSTVIFTVITWT